jgi:hypothetical protein
MLDRHDAKSRRDMNRMIHWRTFVRRASLAIGAASLLPPIAVQGATIVVGCSSDQLKSALAAANSAAGATVLQLAPACTYAFNTPDNGWYGPNALPPIASDISIEGNGATLLIDTGSGPISLRFFYVSGGLSPARGGSTALPAGTLTLHNLTLKSGNAVGGSSHYGGGGAGMGGAIFNQGSVILSADTFVGNQAIGGSTMGASGQYGGGGMGADASGSSGGGFGPFAGTYGGIGGAGTSQSSGGGGGFSADGAGGAIGSTIGGGDSGWGGSGGFFGSLVSGDAGGGANAGSGGDGGDFGTGGALGFFAGGGGGIGGGGGSAGGNGYGAGGGFGGGGGGGFFAGTGGFGGGGGGVHGVEGGYGAGAGAHDLHQGGGAGAGMGGAIFNHNGTLTNVNSTFANNKATGGASTVGGGSGAGLGGAIFNLQGNIEIEDSSLAFNIASGPNASGGAVYNLGYLGGDDGGTLHLQSIVDLRNSILANSSDGTAAIADLATNAPATVSGGVANIATSTVTLVNNNIVMTTSRLGNSVVNGTPLTFDPQLGPLQNNGGPTMTLALQSTSSAFDAGTTTATTDQRGCPRPVGLAADIGAYESSYVAGLIFRDGFEAIVCP